MVISARTDSEETRTRKRTMGRIFMRKMSYDSRRPVLSRELGPFACATISVRSYRGRFSTRLALPFEAPLLSMIRHPFSQRPLEADVAAFFFTLDPFVAA